MPYIHDRHSLPSSIDSRLNNSVTQTQSKTSRVAEALGVQSPIIAVALMGILFFFASELFIAAVCPAPERAGAGTSGGPGGGTVAGGLQEPVPQVMVVPPEAVLQEEADADAQGQDLHQEPDHVVARHG